MPFAIAAVSFFAMASWAEPEAPPARTILQDLMLLGGIVVVIVGVFWLMRLLHRTSDSLSHGSGYSHADSSTTDATSAMYGRHSSHHGSDGNPFD
jgi:hypothetical protein